MQQGHFVNILKNKNLWLAVVLISYTAIRWKSLYMLPWLDEFSYLNTVLIEKDWSFFLPWNYRPEYFMGHPVLQPLALFLALNLFEENVWAAKLTALIFSLICLFCLYRMTKSFFRNEWTAFLSVIFTMFLPLFWLHSTLILAHIPLMAFGFGTIYAFRDQKYKTLFFFSIGLASIRESALAFFLPLVLQGFFVPHYRKSLCFITPALLIFFSHFLIFFLRTGVWFAHPYIYEGLPHNENPDFFNFSIVFDRSAKFFRDFFHQFPLVFWGIFFLTFFFFLYKRLISSTDFKSLFHHKQSLKFQKPLFSKLQIEKNSSLRKLLKSKYFIFLSISISFYGFYIGYPDYGFRNFFPILIIFIPLSIHFIYKYCPLFQILLIFLSSCLFLENISHLSFNKKSGDILEKEIQKKTLETKVFAFYLESNYGPQILKLKKKIYIPFPYDGSMSHPLYGYVKNSYNADHWQFFEEPDRYGIVALIRDKIKYIPYNQKVYEYLKQSSSFIEQSPSLLSKDFILFIHKDIL